MNYSYPVSAFGRRSKLERSLDQVEGHLHTIRLSSFA